MFTLFQRSPVPQRLTRSVVQFPFDLGKHLIGQLAEVRTFRDVLAYQSIRVFVCATFPGVVRTGKVERGVRILFRCQPLSCRFCLYRVAAPRLPCLHPSFTLLLSKVPSVPMVASHIAVPPDLTAHCTCTDPDYFSYLPHAHRRLQQRLNRISLLPC